MTDSLIQTLHDTLCDTDADIAFGKLRHIISEYEKLKSLQSGEMLYNAAETEQMAISRIATWLLQKYDSEYDASQIPLDV